MVVLPASQPALPVAPTLEQVKQVLGLIIRTIYTRGTVQVQTIERERGGRIVGVFLGDGIRFRYTLKDRVLNYAPVNPRDLPKEEPGESFEEFALDFARLKLAGNTKQEKKCKKGYPCGYTCISQNRNCRRPLPGQSGTAADWIASQPIIPSATAAKSKVSVNQSALDTTRADLISRFGNSTVEAAESNVQKILNSEDTGVFIRVGSVDTLNRILGGRVKNAVELQQDSHNIPDLRGGYISARKRVEELTLGIPQNFPDDQRPIYAYLANAKDLNGASHKDPGDSYGDITIKLKDSVKDRATVTGSDSFKSGYGSELKNDGTPPPPNAASLVPVTRHGYTRDDLPGYYPSYLKTDSRDGSMLQSAGKAKDIDELATSLAPTGKKYMEAQVHGQVKAQDIEAVYFTPTATASLPNKEVLDWADKNNIPVYIGGRKREPAEAGAETVTQRISKALDDGDFDTVVRLTDDVFVESKALGNLPGKQDAIMAALNKVSGYDALPKVVSDTEIDRQWQAGGTLAVRGFGTNQKNLDEFRSGTFYASSGNMYGNGTYASFANSQTRQAANDAQRATDRNYYTGSGKAQARMVLDKSAKITNMAQMKKEAQTVKAGLDKWEQAERQRILQRYKIPGAISSAQIQSEAITLRTSYDGLTLKTPKVISDVPVSSAANRWGLARDVTYRLPFRKNKTHPDGEPEPTFTLRINGSGNSQAYSFTDSQGRPQIFYTKKRALEAAQEDYFLSRALTKRGLSQMPDVSGLSAEGNRQLAEIKTRRANAEEVLTGDTGYGNSGRLAILRGYDAVRLEDSYEPDHWAIILNRGKVFVSDANLPTTPYAAAGGITV